MSQNQAACLLANAFLCTFPARNAHCGRKRVNVEDAPRLPSINFHTLFRAPRDSRWDSQMSKLDCIFHYFTRVTTNMPTGTLTFSRRVLPKSLRPDWSTSDVTLGRLHVASTGTIEDNGIGMLQVDFANKFLGGGALGEGCVQEEIRFMICPELIISQLMTEELDSNESLVITGCERFSNYAGYADSFTFKSDHIDNTPRDTWQRRSTEVVAIDALVINSYWDQFEPPCVQRELCKAYCGFRGNTRPLPAVATGNWGCGAFGGDHRLKALIQLMSASQAGRDVCYFTFSDQRLSRDITAIHNYIVTMRLTVGVLYHKITEYYTEHSQNATHRHNLFEFIKNSTQHR